jgi:PAS domain S-box-containing protein
MAPAHTREDLNLGQIGILERVAEGAPLGEALEGIVRLIEGSDDGSICSILLLDRDSGTLRHIAAPNLPPEYLAAIDGSRIGPTAGSCGAAAFRGERVVVEDIATHPFWADYREYALRAGLRSCWSSPIFSPAHEVLGTFAVYHREPRTPTPGELEAVDSATHLAALALTRDRETNALRRSEARYRQLLETTLEGAITLDADGRVTYANRRAGELLGRVPTQLLGRPVFDLVHPSERERLMGMLSRRSRGLSDQVELRMNVDGGGERWAIVAASPILDDSGAVVGSLGLLTDITKRKRAEQALARNEAELRAIVDAAGMCILLVDESTRLLRWNPASARFFGRDPRELDGATLSKLMHPAEMPLNLEKLRLRDGPFESEQRFLRRDGSVAWAKMTVSLLGRGQADDASAVVMLEDVTESRRLEEEVRAAETMRGLIFDSVSDLLYFVSVEPDGRFRFRSVNESFLRTTGLELAQVVGKYVEEVIPEPSLGLVLDRYRRAVFEGRAYRWDETTTYPAGVKQGEATITPVYEPSGRCRGLVGSVHDISERKLAQEKIAEQAALLDHAQDAIMLRDLDGVVRYWNQGAARLYGWPSSEAVGRRITDLLYRAVEDYRQAEDTAVRDGVWRGELTQYDRLGRELVIEGCWTLMRDRQGRPQAILAINTDATEKKRLAARIALAQRMEGLGSLAGGIAHDFNNILGAIMGSVGLAQGYLPSDHRAQRNLAVAMSACGRAAELVRRILAFSRYREPQWRRLQLQPVVTEALQLLRASLPAMIDIRTFWAADVPDVMADAAQIQQVIMNLGTNAAEAMGGRGTLTVRLEPATLEEELRGAFSEVPPGSYARLSVEDTGCGMDEATMARVFDPFFTAKAAGSGTGLGLFAVRSIVLEHQGAVTVTGNPGRGACFTVWLPRAEPTSVDRSNEPPPPGAGNRERILFVDDESSLLAIGSEILTSYGYRVEAFADPAAALQAFRSAPREFDAVITDFAMPGMTGIELARSILELRPGMPVLLSSGHLTPDQEREAQELGLHATLSKPGAAHEMLRALELAFRGADSRRG